MLFWSDHTIIFFTVVWTLTVWTLLQSVFAGIGGRAGFLFERPLLFLFPLGLLMILARWPGFFYPEAFEVDEAQIVAAAMVLESDPVFFRSVDGATSGPLISYALLLSHVLGQPVSLFSSRLIGVIITFGGVVAVWAGLRSFFQEGTARLCASAAAFFFAFTNFWNYAHYNSELLSSALCAAGAACLLVLLRRSHLSDPRLLLPACAGAFFLSLVPFAKLQCVPQALFTGIALVAILCGTLLRGKRAPFLLIRHLVFLAVATLAFPALFLLLVVFTGSWEYFWGSYILNNIAYRSTGAMGFVPVLTHFLKAADDLLHWFPGLLLFSVVSFFPALVAGLRTRRDLTAIGIFVILFVISLISVFLPGRPYCHYLLLLIFPAALLAGALLGSIARKEKHRSTLLWKGIFLACAIAPGLFLEARNPDSWAGTARIWAARPPDPVSQRLLELREDSDGRLLVWGWMPYYHIHTGMLQSGRLSISTPVLFSNEMQEFFREAFLEDLERRPPRWIVDAVAPGSFYYTDRELHGVQAFPAFQAILQEEYSLVDQVGEVLIYRRRD